MRSFKLILIVVMLSMALLVSGAAFADRHSGGSGHQGGYSRGGGHQGSYSGGSDYYGRHYGGRGYYSGGHYGGRGYYGSGYYRGRGYYGGYYGSGLNFWFGWPGWYYPYNYPYNYPYSSYYYPTAVSVPSSPQEYIEQPQRAYDSTPSGIWYYCHESKSYYPYVKECPGGWQTVPAQPPTGSGR
ncbi:MAG: hypothetical protein NTY00_09510 [Deltaproteobacteria bacterium]|nr:hypothetical protein [Deltaproteobacteria bacterium]